MAGRGLLALALERQVSAAERLLTTLATSDVFEEISAQQADAVVQAMATGKLTVLELADLSASVDKVPFAPGDKQKVVDAMALAARDASKPTKNSKEKDDGKQHWQNAWAYVPKEVWESLGEQEVGPFLELLSQMGLGPARRDDVQDIGSHDHGGNRRYRKDAGPQCRGQIGNGQERENVVD